MQSGYHFFMRHAGYSFNPAYQTPLQGRIECAQILARAEKRALLESCSFEWQIDPDMDSSDFSDEAPWKLWVCRMRDFEGDIVQSLWAIDFGRDGTPWGDPYRRVIEAELAREEFAE